MEQLLCKDMAEDREEVSRDDPRQGINHSGYSKPGNPEDKLSEEQTERLSTLLDAMHDKLMNQIRTIRAPDEEPAPVDIEGSEQEAADSGSHWKERNHMQQCSLCCGTGHHSCSVCGGSGTETRTRCETDYENNPVYRTEVISCSSCGGSGKINCSRCGGGGYIVRY
jgi:hypothetical protein